MRRRLIVIGVVPFSRSSEDPEGDNPRATEHAHARDGVIPEVQKISGFTVFVPNVRGAWLMPDAAWPALLAVWSHAREPTALSHGVPEITMGIPACGGCDGGKHAQARDATRPGQRDTPVGAASRQAQSRYQVRPDRRTGTVCPLTQRGIRDRQGHSGEGCNTASGRRTHRAVERPRVLREDMTRPGAPRRAPGLSPPTPA